MESKTEQQWSNEIKTAVRNLNQLISDAVADKSLSVKIDTIIISTMGHSDYEHIDIKVSKEL